VEVTPMAVLAEVQQLSQVRPPGIDAMPHEIVATMIQIRANLDRMQELLTAAQLRRHGAQAQFRADEQAAQTVWDQAATKPRGVRLGNSDSFEGPRERYSQFNLVALEARMKAMETQREFEGWDVCYRATQSYYRNLDGARLDLHARLRAMQFESSLER
jgi:hypothetical protein